MRLLGLGPVAESAIDRHQIDLREAGEIGRIRRRAVIGPELISWQ
jgi:hypothetical protein